jgi:hypothetical protein
MWWGWGVEKTTAFCVLEYYPKFKVFVVELETIGRLLRVNIVCDDIMDQNIPFFWKTGNQHAQETQ